MCIIIHKPAGVEVPSAEILRQCAKRNKDGMGFSMTSSGRVMVAKGYFDVEKLIDVLTTEPDLVTSRDMVIHFRLATSGKIGAGNCHPFSLDSKMLESPFSYTDYAVSHNGIIYDVWGLDKGGLSDTASLVRDVLSPIRNVHKLEKVLRIVASVSGSRFTLSTKGGTQRFGAGWITDKKVHYSNSTYKKYTTYNYSSSANRYLTYKKCPVCKTLVLSYCTKCQFYVSSAKCSKCNGYLIYKAATDANRCPNCDICRVCGTLLLVDGRCPNNCKNYILPGELCPLCQRELITEGNNIMCPRCDWNFNLSTGEFCPHCGHFVIKWFNTIYCPSCHYGAQEMKDYVV